MNTHRNFVLALVWLASCTAALAQSVPSSEMPELVTDRPDFTESSEVVGRGYIQDQNGLSYEHDEEGGVGRGSVTAPAALLRIGLSKRIELRLGTDGLISERGAGQRTNGFGDLEVGVKIRLFDQDKAGVDFAILPIVSLPTGSDEVSSGAADPTVKFTWARRLPAGFDLSGNYNVSSLSDDSGRFVQQALSVSLGHDLFGGWGGYLEAYGFTPIERDSAAGWTIDTGISHLIGRRMQFDVEGGRGVTAAAPDWFVGVGFAIRGRVGR